MMKSSFASKTIAGKISFGRTTPYDGSKNNHQDSQSPTVASLLEQIISMDDTPFLVSQRKLPPTSLIRLDKQSVRLGHVLRKGEFTKTYEVRACRPLATMEALAAAMTAEEEKDDLEQDTSKRKRGVMKRTGRAIRRTWTPSGDSSSGETANQYSIKMLNGVPVLASDRGSTTDGEDGDDVDFKPQIQQRIQLLKEALYLSVLDHPGILQLTAFPMLSSQHIFVVTLRIRETLEDRMTVWRRARRKAKELERIEQERRKMNRRYFRRQKSNDPPLSLFEMEVKSMVPEDLVALKTNYALQIAEALKYLHDRGIVVRELRPDAIGFMDYPYHHQVLLCDLSHAKELPLEEPQMLPSTEPLIPSGEEEDEEDETLLDMSEISRGSMSSPAALLGMGSSSRRLSNASSNMSSSFRSSSLRRSFSASVTFGGRRNGILSRSGIDISSHISAGSGSSSSVLSDLSTNGYSPLKSMPSMDESSPLFMDESGRSTTSTRSRTPSSTAARDCYRAPEMYAVCYSGYNAKVDCYSWAMIYYELLADRRPKRKCDAGTVDEMYQQIRTHRPSLQKCYFPLCTQQVIQQAWETDVSRRYSSEQLTQVLYRVLAVLEGKRLDGRNRNGKKSKHRPLPERAALVVRSEAAKGWSDIRKPVSIRRVPTC